MVKENKNKTVCAREQAEPECFSREQAEPECFLVNRQNLSVFLVNRQNLSVFLPTPFSCISCDFEMHENGVAGWKKSTQVPSVHLRHESCPRKLSEGCTVVFC